ncbi:MAG: hypothetical protein QM758_05830 [Armatimonas sp.]
MKLVDVWIKIHDEIEKKFEVLSKKSQLDLYKASFSGGAFLLTSVICFLCKKHGIPDDQVLLIGLSTTAAFQPLSILLAAKLWDGSTERMDYHRNPVKLIQYYERRLLIEIARVRSLGLGKEVEDQLVKEAFDKTKEKIDSISLLIEDQNMFNIVTTAQKSIELLDENHLKQIDTSGIPDQSIELLTRRLTEEHAPTLKSEIQ